MPSSPADSTKAVPKPPHAGAGIVARGVSVATPGGVPILTGVDLTVLPGEFVLIIGPSGAGKTTLLDVLSGRRPPNAGSVRVGGRSLYAETEDGENALPAGAVGYVPQADIVHRRLPVERALRYAARLRLPDANAAEIDRRVELALERTGLVPCRATLIEDLSGGQRRRVSLASELVSDPAILFIDEATSGLDAAAEAMLMELFRRLAHGGTTVCCITHQLDRVDLADRVLVLHDGRLVGAGSPRALAGRFGIEELGLVYSRLREKEAPAWAAEHEAAAAADPRETERAVPADRTLDAPPRPPVHRGVATALRQAVLVAERQAELLWYDPKTLLFLLFQAPIVALSVRVAFLWTDWARELTPMSAYRVVFLAVTAVVWFSLNNSIREVAKEADIYRRERGVGLSPAAYLGGKTAVLALLSVVQVAALVSIVFGMPIHAGYVVPPFQQGVLLALLALSGLGIGLGLSSLVSTPDRAAALAPFVVLPQIVFSGVLVPIKGTFLGNTAPLVIPSYWAYRGGRAAETDDWLANLDRWRFPDALADAPVPQRVGFMAQVLGDEAMPYVDGIRTEALALAAFGAVSLLAAYVLLRRWDVPRSRPASLGGVGDRSPPMPDAPRSSVVLRFDLGVLLAVALAAAAAVAWSDLDRRVEASREGNRRIEAQLAALVEAQRDAQGVLERRLEQQRTDIQAVASEVVAMIGGELQGGTGEAASDARIASIAADIERELREALSHRTEQARTAIDEEVREVLRVLIDRFRAEEEPPPAPDGAAPEAGAAPPPDAPPAPPAPGEGGEGEGGQ